MNVPGVVQSECAEVAQLKAMLALYEAALANMSHGMWMVDAEQRVVLFNQRMLEMFGLDPGTIRVGMPISELMAHSSARGNILPAQLEEVTRRRRELMARDQRAAQQRRLTQLAIAAAVAALIGAALWALRGGL